MSRWVAMVVVLAACASGRSRFEIRSVSAKEFRIGIETTDFEVQNGMKVVLLRDPNLEVVEVDVRYQVGSRDDPPGKAGLAHLVEHLMFEQRLGGADRPSIGARLREHALFVNASTGFDSTHFEAQARIERFGELVSVEATRLLVGCKTLTPAVVAREREVVRNEINERARQNPLRPALLAALYPPGHPYDHPPGGTLAGLDAITLDDVCRFVDDYYAPERAFLVVAGNLEPRQVLEALAPMTSVPRRRAAPRRPVPAVDRAPRELVIEADVDDEEVFGAWPAPPQYSETADHTTFALAVASSYVDAGLWGGADAPFVGAVMSGRPETFFDVIAGATYLQTDHLLEGHRIRWRVNALTSIEALADRTRRYADWMQFGSESGAHLRAAFTRIDRYDLGQLQDDLKNLFDRRVLTRIVVRPRRGGAVPPARTIVLEPPGEDALSVDASEAAHEVELPRDPTGLAGARRLVLENGLEVLLVATPASVPMVTARLSFAAGTADEDEDRGGLAAMAAQALWSEAAYANSELFALDETREVETERTTFQMHGFSGNLDVMLATLGSLMIEGDYLLGSAARPGDRGYYMLKFRQALRRALAKQRARLGGQRAVLEALFGAGHPYARGLSPDLDSLDRVHESDLTAFRDRYYVARNATLIIAGAVDAPEAEKLARKYLSGLRGGSAKAPAPRISVHGAAIAIVGKGSPSVPVTMAWAVAADDARRAARLVAARMLERRMGVLRERLGASYGAHAMLLSLIAGGAYLVRANVDAQRAGEAVVAMREQAASLARGEHLEADLVHARHAVLEELIGRATSSTERAAQLENMGTRGATYPDEVARAVARVTVDDVSRVLATDLDPGDEVLAVEGARPVVERAFTAAGVAHPVFVSTRP